MKNANSIFRLDAMARRGQARAHTKLLPRPSTPASTPAQPPPSPIPCFLTPSTFSLLSSPMHLFLTFFFLFSPFPSCFHVSPSLIFSVFFLFLFPSSFLFPFSVFLSPLLSFLSCLLFYSPSISPFCSISPPLFFLFPICTLSPFILYLRSFFFSHLTNLFHFLSLTLFLLFLLS